MIRSEGKSHIIKIVLLIVWLAAIVFAYWYLHAHGIRLRMLPAFIREQALHAGFLGPLSIIAIYLASSLLLLSKIPIEIIAGTIYGGFWGSLIIALAVNLAGMILFFLGRFLGFHLVQEHERGWVKKYNELLREEGFVTVLLMRFFLFPFDLVSFGCGMSEMKTADYLLGTFFGSIPGIITFVALGGAIRNPRTWLLFGVLLVLTLGAVYYLRRHPWIKHKFFKDKEQDSCVRRNDSV